MSEEEAATGRRHHATLFVRPDSLLHSPFPWQQLERMAEDEVLLPHVHSWGGYNDRFAAICSPRAAAYADRIQDISMWRARQPAGSMPRAEEHLKHTLLAHGLRVKYLGMKFSLVRPGGAVYKA